MSVPVALSCLFNLSILTTSYASCLFYVSALGNSDMKLPSACLFHVSLACCLARSTVQRLCRARCYVQLWQRAYFGHENGLLMFLLCYLKWHGTVPQTIDQLGVPRFLFQTWKRRAHVKIMSQDFSRIGIVPVNMSVSFKQTRLDTKTAYLCFFSVSLKNAYQNFPNRHNAIYLTCLFYV